MERVYGRPPLSLLDLNEDESLVFDRRAGSTFRVPTDWARAARACTGVMDLEGHIRQIAAKATAGDVAAAHRLGRSLVDWGLLLEVAAGQRSGSAHQGRIEGVAIITSRRPAECARALASLTDGRVPASTGIAVIDGDSSSEAGGDTRALVEARRAKCGNGLIYVGASQVSRIVDEIIAAGIPPAIASGALTLGRIGANRNAVAAMYAGCQFVMQDDDVVANIWRSPGESGRVVIGGHKDLRRWDFFEGASDAVAVHCDERMDVVTEHGAVLGQQLRELLQGADVDYRYACDHMTETLASDSCDRIRVTMMGLAGDSGRFCPYGVVFGPTTARETVGFNISTALSSRHVRNIANNLTISHETPCMAYCVGIDAVDIIPPFRPSGRNEDGLWGVTLQVVSGALFAHLPSGVLHLPNRAGSYNTAAPSAAALRTADLIIMLTRRLAAALPGTSTEGRMREVGRRLADIGKWPPKDLGLLITEMRMASLAAFLDQMRRTATNGRRTDEWRSALDRYVDEVAAASRTDTFAIPLEAVQQQGIERSLIALGRSIEEYGDLLAWWPEIWSVMKTRSETWRALLQWEQS